MPVVFAAFAGVSIQLISLTSREISFTVASIIFLVVKFPFN